ALPGDAMHCLAVPMGPADKQETGSLFFVGAINAAHERVWITTPYLIPDEAVIAALQGLVETHTIYRVKGFAALPGAAMRLVIQGVGRRFDSYFD
ncbi:GTP-binding protein, partial [Paraburkholderia sp. SIMBA_049]